MQRGTWKIYNFDKRYIFNILQLVGLYLGMFGKFRFSVAVKELFCLAVDPIMFFLNQLFSPSFIVVGNSVVLN